MTVSSENLRNDYTGNGIASTFAFDFKILSDSDIKVVKKLVASPYTATTLTLTTDYTVDGVGDTDGSITLVAGALSSDYTLHLLINPDVTQESSFRDQARFSASTNETALDSLLNVSKRLKRATDASIKIPESEDPDDYSLTLEGAADRANTYLHFDTEGSPEHVSGTFSEVAAEDTVQVVDTIAALKALTVATIVNKSMYFVRGYSSAGDGGGGLFKWNSSDSSTDNVGTIVAPTVGSGRWNRVYDSGIFNVKWFGAKGDGTTDDTTALQDALNAVDDTYGGTVYFPGGKYIHSSALVLKKRTLLRGAGKTSTIIQSDHTGDGIQSTWTINSSTAVWIDLEDLTIKNTNASNTGGGFADVGGTYITLTRVIVSGFMYGMILDQSELVDILNCDYELNLQAGLWIVDGDDHTATASTQYSNRISVTGCQFNQNMGTGYGILDDGGLAHAFRDNNYNGFITHIRAAGAQGLEILGGEFEAASSANILFVSTTFNSSSSVGICTAVMLGGGAIFVPQAGQSCVSLTGLATIVYSGVHFGNTAVAKVVGNANCNTCIALGIWNAAGGDTFDALAVRHFELNPSIGGTGTANTFTNMAPVLSTMMALKRVAVTYSASMTPDASLANEFDMTATNGTAFTVNAPTNATDGQRITLTIRNGSGGVLGAITWDALFKMAAWTSPANATSRSIDFKYNGTNWVEVGRTTADVPN